MKADLAKLDRMFNPQCVVVIGDTGSFRWLQGQSTIKGKLYSVHVNPKTIKGIEAMGIKNYTSLLDIPDPVDLVIVAVPRAVAPAVLEDCIRKEVAGAHFFTAGFAETHTEEGIRLGRLLTERAEAANFHLIGPNCMGIFNPKVGIRQSEGQYTGVSGPVGFISQSGTHAVNFGLEAHLQGMDINKSVSFGNGAVLDSAEFLDYFGRDEDIKAIGMYLEGVRDGKRFFQVLREVAARKPVVVWKGGRTEGGSRAIASHTGSLAIPHVIWDAALRQCGAVTVDRMDELIDALKALLYLSPVYGNRVALAGGSGGQSVAITDAFTEAGLEVPRLTQESYDELATFFSLIGGGYVNPIDTGNSNRAQLARIVDIIERDANIDNIVLLIGMGWGGSDDQEDPDREINSVIDLRKRTSKPVVATLNCAFSSGAVRQARDALVKLQNGGVPGFVTVERAAIAMKKTLDYYRFRSSDASQ